MSHKIYFIGSGQLHFILTTIHTIQSWHFQCSVVSTALNEPTTWIYMLSPGIGVGKSLYPWNPQMVGRLSSMDHWDGLWNRVHRNSPGEWTSRYCFRALVHKLRSGIVIHQGWNRIDLDPGFPWSLVSGGLIWSLELTIWWGWNQAFVTNLMPEATSAVLEVEHISTNFIRASFQPEYRIILDLASLRANLVWVLLR